MIWCEVRIHELGYMFESTIVELYKTHKASGPFPRTKGIHTDAASTGVGVGVGVLVNLEFGKLLIFTLPRVLVAALVCSDLIAGVYILASQSGVPKHVSQ